MNFWLDDKRRTAKRSDKETASDREEAGKDRRLVTSPRYGRRYISTNPAKVPLLSSQAGSGQNKAQFTPRFLAFICCR
jgi:hypothetical protein